ncbi:hypothetical protein Unana1_01506 [Umbelopsis nana]
MDRKGTAMSDVSTLCQDKDFLYLTDEDREAHQLWLQYIPRAHPVSGVPVQTVFAGKKRPRYRGMVTFAVCGAFIITGTIVCFAHFKDQVKANSEQMISIYYGLLSLAAVLLSCNIASVLSVSLDKWRGILPRFVRRLDIVFILSCGQWSVIRMICTANHSYFTCLLSNVLQTLFSQIFSLAFAGGDVFSSYASIITSLASWYSVIPILIGTAFISTYLFCMASRIVYYPTEHDTVRRFVLGAAPGCYVVGAAQVSCIHRMREARIAYSKNSKDLEKNAYYLEHEIPLFGWEATHVTEHSTRAHNVQTYVLTDGSLDEVQRAMHWAVSTNENIYMQGYLECGYCACTMAQLLRCNIVIVQRSGYLAPAVVKRAKTKRFMNILHNLSTPWKATPCL